MRLLIIIAALIPSFASAQIGVDEYRNSVVDYSYSLQRASASVEYYDALLRFEQTSRLPALTLSGDFVEQFRSMSGSQEQWSFSLQPQITQTLYKGGALRAAVRKAEFAADAAEADMLNSLLEICYMADYAFYDLAAMRSYREAVDQYVAIVAALKEVVELRYNEGYISKGDLLMIETRLSEALYDQIALDEDYTIALQKFNILRGYSADVLVVQSEVDVESVAPPVRSSLEELLARRPDYLASQLAEDQAQSAVVIARAAYNPTISVGVAGQWRSDTPNLNGSTIMDGSLFVRLSAPIFHFAERRYAVSAAQQLRTSSALTTLALIDDIRLEESNMWAKIVDSKAQLDAARRALAIGGENLEISTYSYSEGLTTILDVMQAQISWLQLYANSILSEFNYLVSLSAYRRITAVVTN
ncbi:MAG: TolC family protein [Rikenellaceae bacterium]